MPAQLHEEFAATERSPLLGHGNNSANSRVDDHADDANADAGDVGNNGILVAEEPGTGKLLLIMGSVWVGCFLNALDTTIVATLTAPISNSFNSFTLVSWLASSYLIASAAFQPLSGKLTDIFGRRAGLIWCNLFFLAGNLICGLAREEWVMILGRVVAGIGGGGLNSISTFIASDLIPLRRRGLWQGIGNVCYGVGAGLGGIVGGAIHDRWGWPWAFLFQSPIIFISTLLVIFTVKIPIKEENMSKIKRVDFLGAFLLVASLVLLLVGLNSGGNIMPWTHPLVIASILGSLACLGLFVYVEDQVASEPVIPVRLLLDRTVAAACLTNWFDTMGQYALLYYGPIFFQIMGKSATEAGERFVPQALGTAVGSLGSGYIMRVTGRYYALNIFTESLKVLAAVLVLATFNLTMPDWPPFIYFFMMGAGYAGMLTVTLLALIAAVDHEHQAVITSASYACRSTGSSIGITIASAVFQNILKQQLWERFGDRPNAAQEISRIRDSIDEIKSLPPGWRDGVMDSYMFALRGVFSAVLGLCVLGMICSLFMREHKLHTNLARR